MPELDWLEMRPNASWCIGFQVPKCVVMHQLRLFFQIFPWVNRSKYLSFKSAQCDPFIYGKIWKKSRSWCITTHWVNLKPDASWHIWPHLESIQLRHNKYDLIILKYIHTYIFKRLDTRIYLFAKNLEEVLLLFFSLKTGNVCQISGWNWHEKNIKCPVLLLLSM